MTTSNSEEFELLPKAQNLCPKSKSRIENFVLSDDPYKCPIDYQPCIHPSDDYSATANENLFCTLTYDPLSACPVTSFEIVADLSDEQTERIESSEGLLNVENYDDNYYIIISREPNNPPLKNLTMLRVDSQNDSYSASTNIGYKVERTDCPVKTSLDFATAFQAETFKLAEVRAEYVNARGWFG